MKIYFTRLMTDLSGAGFNPPWKMAAVDTHNKDSFAGYYKGRPLVCPQITFKDYRHACLGGVNITGGTFRHTDLRHADLSNGRFGGTEFIHCDLTGADLTGARFTNAYFEQCRFTDDQLDDVFLDDETVIDYRRG